MRKLRILSIGKRVDATFAPKKGRALARRAKDSLELEQPLAASFALPATVSSGAAPQTTVIEEIREDLLELPYYGVFDFLAFGYDQGTVTLQGYAYALGLKRDAERAVKRVAGVDTVKNEIEEPFGPPRFAGLEPAGDYPIHIVVKGGRITLLGVVENDTDKTIAGMKARSVPGAFGVENELVVEAPRKKTTTR